MHKPDIAARIVMTDQPTHIRVLRTIYTYQRTNGCGVLASVLNDRCSHFAKAKRVRSALSYLLGEGKIECVEEGKTLRYSILYEGERTLAAVVNESEENA